MSAVARWDRDGFARVAEFVTVDELSDVARRLRAIFARAESFGPTRVHRSRDLNGSLTSIEVLDTIDADPQLRSSVLYEACYEAARELLGVAPVVFFDHSIHKPSQLGSGTAWHQDIIYDRYERQRDRVHFWIPMTDVGLDGGCMEFLPGSHRQGLLPHAYAPGDPSGHTQVARDPSQPTVAVPLNAGDVTMHHQATLHRTGPNRSGSARTAWILQFARPRTVPERFAENRRRATRLGKRLTGRPGWL